jgi:ubiquinone/menaquinone biosynthesis C-methylase UbiE
MTEFTPEAYDDEYGEAEWERLEGDLYGRLEYDETWHYLDRELPESGRVLDVGGGAGRYAIDLAERGYDVTLVDRSSEQAAVAREKVADHGVVESVAVRTGDVRALDFEADSFDATLCLGGPLSHVLDADDRRDAVAELRRVTVPDGPVFVSVMGRLAALQTVARMAGRVDEGDDETAVLPRLARTGDYDAELLEDLGLEPSGPPMHLFRAAELRELLQGAGLAVHTITGLESVVSQRRDEFDALEDGHRDALRETVATLRGDPGVADLSGHMLAVASARPARA